MSGRVRLEVQSAQGAYPVVVGAGVRYALPEILADLRLDDRRIAVITDEIVRETPFFAGLLAALQGVGRGLLTLQFPAGDAHKSLATAAELYHGLVRGGFRRGDVILAVGGGVVGDLAGFVAATYMRGVPYVQVPTTLLAHDSAIGGKVGVNLEEGKNLVGAFYPPRAVLFDTEALTTLDARQWRNGMAEVIKHAIIADPDLFLRLETQPMPQLADPSGFVDIAARAMRVKVDVVTQDERESGLRQVLNVGHTVGHAVEQFSGYALGHGEAVSIGLVVEAAIAANRGLLSWADAQRIASALERHGLPTRPPYADVDAVLKLVEVDKKHTHDGWVFALPAAIGRVEIVRVKPDEVRVAYEQVREGHRP
ncbi:3-dehydroquinate synthase [Alicyclobacillus vulcanalis]|uniref:3-dehydroquinate synthase n=2 Tax=Alicyclobacillus TaxID=29330 RepID=A0A1N7NDQ7_9BACL|nr:3-dehydroquinate synthase [Alicyclobacillus vulcanalis]SIS96450.1 3-dehydroquinate synthase [Alicyclobacillus vulcanalis]